MHFLFKPHPKRLLTRPGLTTVSALALLLFLTAGCRNAQTLAQTDSEAGAAARLRAAVEREAAQPAKPFNLDLEPPAVLADDSIQVQPRTGDSLQKASLTFDQVLEKLPLPSYLEPLASSVTDAEREAGEEDADPVASDQPEAPSAAVRAYVKGRAAYQEGDRSQAIAYLEQARRLDPDSAHILRMLGTVYLARGDEVRGARRLRQAVELESDPQSLFLLGRFAFRKGDWGETIVAMARSKRADPALLDPAVQYLRPYYLGQALLQEGYDAAAIQQLNEYLKIPERFAHTTRLLRELAFLLRQRGRTIVQIGDAHARLGQFDQALEQYRRAADAEAAETSADDQMLTARRVYALLAMHRPRTAEKMLIDEIRESTPSLRLLDLTPYVASHSGDRDRFLQVMRGIYQESDRPATLALAVARLLEDDQAANFLADHAAARPEDAAVYDQLIEELSGDDPARLVAIVLEMIRARPQSAQQYAAQLLEQDLDADRLLAQLDGLPQEERQSAAAWYLRGAIEESAGRIEKAVAAYDRALAADNSFVSPQLASVELQVRLGHFEEALELLDKVSDPGAAKVRYARARILTGLGRADEGAAILDRLIAEQPRNIRYRMLKAQLQSMAKDYTAAERTLWSIIDIDPTNQDAYTALFNLYDSDPRADASQVIRLMKRVQREIPQSRIARIKMAEWHTARREYDLAEENLRGVLSENPADNVALSRLVDVLKEADRWKDAQTLLIEHMEQRPDDPIPLLLFEKVAEELGDTQEFYARKETFLKRRESSMEKWVALAQLYGQWNKPDKAIGALEQAVEAEPGQAAQLRPLLAQLYLRVGETDKAIEQIDLAIAEKPQRVASLYYFKAQIYHQEDAPQKAEQTLLDALEADPDHALSNNDLGYLWADQGRNLDRALEMTRKAVAAEPGSGAFLDSLGWVHYKLGQFQEAVNRLQEARTKPDGKDPVILDHLADALWRLGQKPQARNLWQEALRAADRIDAQQRPGITDLRETLDAKIEAARNDMPSPVAPIPGDGARDE